MLNFIQFELFLIIPIGRHTAFIQYVVNLIKTIKLNNLTNLRHNRQSGYMS